MGYVMSAKQFGKKCKCGHFEGEHQSRKKSTSIESEIQDYAYIMPPSGFPSEFIRGQCNICDCKKFDSK